MQRFAIALLAVAAAGAVAGCGIHGDRDRQQSTAGNLQLNLLTRADALPEGHPPVDGYHRALPEGHPPVAGHGGGLPPGHPVCPAGRQLLERGTTQGWDGQSAGPQIISI